MASENVVIVGSGQGGYQAAASLRDEGFGGAITIVGDEPGLPYQRPPLSKAYLTGKTDADGLLLRAAPFYAERGIEILAPEAAVAIDRVARLVQLRSGRALPYGNLILATGARNRLLPVPGAEHDGIFYLRSREDADLIRARLDDAKRIVVVGAGFIGLEFAAVAAAQGRDVTVLEALGRPMARALSRPMSEYFHRAHEAAGLKLRLGETVSRITAEDGRVTGVETADGDHVPADLIVVGIGVVPNVELAAEAGLAVENGIRVDAELLTADPTISAIGDCVSYPGPFAEGRLVRLESVQNAVDQAKCVAARIAGKPAPYGAVPWFWSDQGTMKLQMVGLTEGHDLTVSRGDPAGGAFSVFCYRGEVLLGVESVNRPADHMIARRLLAKGINLPPAEARDASLDLKARANALLASA